MHDNETLFLSVSRSKPRDISSQYKQRVKISVSIGIGCGEKSVKIARGPGPLYPCSVLGRNLNYKY